MTDSRLTTARSSFTAAHLSDGETESETIDDYSQYSDKANSKFDAGLSLDFRSETPNSNNRSTTLNGIDSRTIDKLTDDLSLTEDKDNSEDIMVEISKKTTIKKIISRTTSVNGVTQSSEVEEFLIKDSHKNENGWDGCSKLIKSPKSQHRFHHEEETLNDKKNIMSTQNEIPNRNVDKSPIQIDHVDVDEYIEVKKSDKNYSGNLKVSPRSRSDENGVGDKRGILVNKENDIKKIGQLPDSVNSGTGNMENITNRRRESWQQIDECDSSRNVLPHSRHRRSTKQTEHKEMNASQPMFENYKEKDNNKKEIRTFNKYDETGINKDLKESALRVSGNKTSHAGVKKIKWVDPFKSYHLKYDSKDDVRSMQNWIKQKRVALMKSNQNQRPKDIVDGKSNRRSAYHRSASPVKSQNYKDIKEYIIRGNIKENLFQNRHPYSLEFNSDYSRQNKYPEYTYSNPPHKMDNSLTNINEKQSLSVIDKLDRRNSDISFQVSKILNKFDLIEEDMKFKYYNPTFTRKYSSNSRLDGHLTGHCCNFYPHSCCHCHSSCTLAAMAERFLTQELETNEHRLLPVPNKRKVLDVYSPVKNKIEKDSSRSNTLSRFNGGQLSISESESSSRLICERHISYLEKKLNMLERKIFDIKLDKDRPRFEYETDLQCQRQDIERELNSLYIWNFREAA